MSFRNYTLPLFLLIIAIGPFTNSLAQVDLPSDKYATKQTIALYQNLKKLMHKGIMFGHQDDLAYGVGWQYEDARSDIKDVTGDYPAVYGWELGRIETGQPQNLDGVPFDKIKEYIKTGHERGGVITISWHLDNPLTGKSAWEPAEGTVKSILPGGEKNNLYKRWLDTIAGFMISLRDKNGDLIPVIFRPFHELNGSWFWWGKNHCTPEQLKQLYQFTETYLHDVKSVHNLLYAYNTDRFTGREEYLERYPGDEYVDVIGFDIYQRGTDNAKFVEEADKSLTTLENIASEKNKIPAMTEFGYGLLPDATWWTNALLKAIEDHKISYVLAWRNAGKKKDGTGEFYVPYKGQASAENFIQFYKNDKTLFQQDIAKEKIYQ